ncbi:MAG: hypothetical protein WBN69_12035 [Eudoraea sp.]
MKTQKILSIAISCLFILGITEYGFSQEVEKDSIPNGDDIEKLAKASQNPLANIMSFPFQFNSSFKIGPYDRTANVLNFQPVIPFANGRIITRSIIPVAWIPDITNESGMYSSGLTDIQVMAGYSPKTKGYTFGVGPVLGFPTGGVKRGSQKWSAGPALIFMVNPGPWVLGFLASNLWSYAGDPDRSEVNAMTLMPFVNYNFGKTGWYLSSVPIITADWEATSGNKWVVPLGGTIGKLKRVGKVGLPINIQAGAFYNVVSPEIGPKWSTRVQVQILLPKHR